ncbi:uncharacterized protein LOC120448842 isoform X2 [Drosophila santomea]|uniref:uncharacterized protein LOC120448842 isoform X2 n=1 Tax=Drosophila santomea TaxID=129105 RepID=UPI001CCE8B67|nr:uncharacterized protein LOC120448842 isoform X2 [Drosophila santomea]
MSRRSLFDVDDDQQFRKMASGDAVNYPKKKSTEPIYNQDGSDNKSAFRAVNETHPNPIPSKVRIDNVVQDFGLEENPDPKNRQMPQPSSSRNVKSRRRPNERKISPDVRQTVPKPTVGTEPSPLMESVETVVDEHDTDMPSSEDIWKSFMDVKNGLIKPSEAVWPLCCMANSEAPKTPPPSLSESPNSNEFPPKRVRVNENRNKNTFETGFGRKIGENEQRVLDQWIESEGLNGYHNDREEWDSKGKVDSEAQKPQILDNEDVAVANYTIGIEEERAIKEWIKSEGLNEPHSDIEEFDMLLSLAREHEKNRDLLLELLKPKDLISQEKDVWKKFSPKVFEMPQNPDSVEPELWKPAPNEKVSVENIPEKEQQKATEFNVGKPEKPVILEVKDIKPLPPRPEDEEAIQSWLQQCSEIIYQQLQVLIYEDSSNNPTAAEPSETVRLEDFEYILDQNMTEFRDPQAKRLRLKWNQQFGSKSLENLRRCLLLPPLPDHLDQCLQRIRILRRPNKRKVVELRMRVEMNFCKMYCTLSINKKLNLQNTVRNLRNAVYNDDIDVIQVRYEATQIAWIWSDGSVLIINGRGHEMLAETQRDLMFRTLGKANFKADSSNKLLHLRLISCGHFPWGISLPEFTASSVLFPEPHMKYVYYVDKAVPGVAARVHETGMIQVFAMTTGEADNMLKKLYLLTANHRKATIDVIKKEPMDYD